MAIFRNADTISLSMLDFLRIVQPDLDTKPGTVARELFVDLPAVEISKLYIELRNVSNLQSLASARGADLYKLARNFGLTRGTGSSASGVVVYTAASLESDIPIPANSLVGARNGFTYRVLSTTTMLQANANVYRANAIRLRSDLDLAGISDEFAIEVAVEATSAGAGGNAAKFSVITHSIAGVSSVTNLQSFTGGSSSETDDAFRARILSVFAGSNTGTALGYINALLTDPRIQDILTVEPGDPLMTRDGTDTSTNSSGERVIISVGTGGKVDIYIQGSAQEQFTESFIYRDQSGKNDPTDERNDFVLGQRGISDELDFQQRRRLSLQSGQIPFQPVEQIVSVSGSLSGPNFIEATTDDAGNLVGSFQLVKDDGAFGGSPFGFDTLHFISGEISLEDEATIKGQLNSQDALDFTDVAEVSSVSQPISVVNEHASVGSDRTLLTLSHAPVTSVERIVNITTGERYSLDQLNPNGSEGEENSTGVIKISGRTLPTSTDILQVSYVWDAQYDEVIDFDNLTEFSDFRTVQDSIDWGFSNRVIREEHTVLYSVDDGYHILLNHPATKIVNVNTISEESVVASSSKLIVTDLIENIVDVRDGYGREVFNTAAADGSFSARQITLPTDTLLQNGQTAIVRYNADDLFSPDGYEVGTFTDELVILPSGTISAGATVYADYVANLEQILPSTSLASLPAVGVQNTFEVDDVEIGTQPVTNLFDDGEITQNVRFAPSYLRMNVQGIPSRGRISVAGTSFRKIEDVITVRTTSLTIDLEESIQSYLDEDETPSTVHIAYVQKIERVTVEDGEVSSVDHVLDLTNYEILDNTWSNQSAIEDADLSATEVSLQSTAENLENIPTVGEKLRVVFYIVNTAQTENIVFSTAGTQYTKYKYAFVDSISVASGFTSLSGVVSGTIAITSANQPQSGSQYFTTYSYTAPKEGERITISYLYNRLIADATLRIEDVRPITADVLIKAASEVALDISLDVILTSAAQNNEVAVKQNINEAIVVFITSGGLEATVDASDIINAVYSVEGVDRVVLTKFNTSGLSGILKSVSASRKEYFVAGEIEVAIEER